MDTDSKLLELLYHHIVLPRRLPQRQDWDHEGLSYSLLKLLLEAANIMCATIAENHKDKWGRVIEALIKFNKIHHQNLVVEDFLQDALTNLKKGHMLILHVMEQNAGVLIFRHQE